jgi:exosortase E/protease (VPEID-CTERM system)
LTTTSASIERLSHAQAMRTGAWIVVCFAELLAISVVQDFQVAVKWYNPIYYVRMLAVWALCAGAAFILLSWHERNELLHRWQTAQQSHDWRAPLVLNFALFCTTLALAPVMTRLSAGAAGSGAAVLPAAYALLVVATGVTLLRLDVPIRALAEMAWHYRARLALALAAGALVEVVSYLAQDGWHVLAGATLEVVRAILALYETDVAVDAAEYALSIGRFKVIIADNCSGYEGIGLVSGFLAIYLWVFRKTLRFPHAFLLFPLGVACIWLLNAVRIAALVSIGAHLSPEIAKQGFHSQAGWIAFLAVTAGIMALASRSAFFTPGAMVRHRTCDERTAAGYLVPFIVLMLSSTLVAAAAPNDVALYPVKVACVGFALWLYRDAYRDLDWRSPGGLPLLAGLVVGAAWIATDPDPDKGAKLETWLGQQSVGWLIAWLGLRVIGSAVVVPIVEELAFRGFLYRWLVSRNFTTVPFCHLSIVALVVSSLLFGMLHERWIAATLSGVVFALVMWRTDRLSAAIVAHAATNALICAWAIGFGQWSLL